MVNFLKPVSSKHRVVFGVATILTELKSHLRERSQER